MQQEAEGMHEGMRKSAQSENSCAAMRRWPCARPESARRRPLRVWHRPVADALGAALVAAADDDVTTTAICVVVGAALLVAGAASDALLVAVVGSGAGAGVEDVVAAGAEDVVAGAGSAAPEDAPSQTAGPGIFRPYGLEYTLKFA